MTATNHALTGALIAAIVPNPFIGLPLAFVSHFVLDALPHFGKHPKMHYTSKAFMLLVVIDALIAISLLITLALLIPRDFWLIFAGGALAFSPDLMWFPGYVRALLGKEERPLKKIAHFHLRIQWAELPHGWRYEIVWFVIMLLVLAKVVLI